MTDSTQPSTPWLECANLRVRERERELSESLTFEASADRVGLVGNFRALFALLARRADIAAGYATVDRAPLQTAVRDGHVGLALYDVAFPAKLNAEEYLEHSAQLLGLGPSEAARAARQTLGTLGLFALAKRKLGTLSVYEKRVLLIAHASLGNPRVVCLESPLARLDPASQGFVRSVLERAASGRRLLISIQDPKDPHERDLLATMQQVIMFGSDGTPVHVAPSTVTESGRRYTVVVTKHAETLVSALEQCGCRARLTGDAGLLEPLLNPESQQTARRLEVELPPEAQPALIVQTALAAEALVIELLPC